MPFVEDEEGRATARTTIGARAEEALPLLLPRRCCCSFWAGRICEPARRVTEDCIVDFQGEKPSREGEKERRFSEEKVIFFFAFSQTSIAPLSLELVTTFDAIKKGKKMVSQQLSCPSPRGLPASLLPASSLEPLQEDERVLCSFERVGVAAGGADENAASAAEEANADAVGTLHVTTRCEEIEL